MKCALYGSKSVYSGMLRLGSVQTVIFTSVVCQDMSSLMHSIYEVVDSSVNQSCNSKRKTLRVKLTVTPEPAARRKDGKHSATG